MDELTAAETLPDPTSVREGGFSKSQETKRRILDAMLRLLAEQGYAATSMPAVAKAAGMSRTAMLHHFPSRRVLLDAVVRHVMRRRIELHEAFVSGIPRDQRFRGVAVDASWEQLQAVEFKAYYELSVAARTDAELNQVFQETLEAFDRARRDVGVKLAEPSVANSPVFDLRRDIHRLVMEGMVTGEGIAFDVEKRSSELVAFLKLLWSDEGAAFLRRAQALALEPTGK
ncbi:MAG: helix-turn-helix domain-containing protein [Pseudomonadota bacterium]